MAVAKEFQDLEDSDELDLALSTSSLSLKDSTTAAVTPSSSAIPHAEVTLEELVRAKWPPSFHRLHAQLPALQLATLPPLISYTPVQIPLSATSTTGSSSSSATTIVFRRDLFDARFQVLTQSEEAEAEEGEGKGKAKEELFVDESSDLIKGVYEGGLKTWECSLDLIDCLDGLGYGADRLGEAKVAGKSVLEVGCGTALPTCAIFFRLLCELHARSKTHGESPLTRIHLQDYNKQVLSLITFPNILLAYAHFLLTIDSFPTPSSPPDSPTQPPPGELEVTPELLDSFESFLKTERIELKFFEGDWDSMRLNATEEETRNYDLVLTSETIYSPSSLPSLLRLLLSSCSSRESTCLVACKRIYFGVGGGEVDFRRQVEEMKGTVETVWGTGEGEGRSKGVGRVVMSVKW